MKTEIISIVFSDYNTVRLKTNNRKEKKNFKKHKYRKLNSMLLNNQQITEEIKMEIKKFSKIKKLKTNDNKSTMTQNHGVQQKKFLEGSFQQYKPTSGNKKNIE